MAPPAGVSVRVLAADGGAAAPAVHGESILGVLGVATARAGATALFDTAPVWLAEAGTGDQRAVLLAAAPPPDDQAQALLGSSAGCGVLTHLGRQHELWREIPRLRAGPPDPSKHVKTAAVVIVVDAAGSVLLTRRAASMRSYPGCWVLPGGGVDAGESLSAAAAREVAEETGLHVSSAQLAPVAAWESAFPLTPDTFAAAGGVLRVHTLMVAFAARVAGVQPPLRLQPAEVDVATWVSPPHLAALLDSTLTAAQAPAAVVSDAGDVAPAATMSPASVAAAQLLGVYPNGLSPPEGLGLAHHYVLGRWLDAGCPCAPAAEGAPAAS